jgi:hypothetical protein
MLAQFIGMFADMLPERDYRRERAAATPNGEARPSSWREKDVALLHPYEKVAQWVHLNVTSQVWFEGFVLFNILLVGIATGLDLENQHGDEITDKFVAVVSLVTMTVFTIECALKIAAEGFRPLNYFIDEKMEDSTHLIL